MVKHLMSSCWHAHVIRSLKGRAARRARSAYAFPPARTKRGSGGAGRGGQVCQRSSAALCVRSSAAGQLGGRPIKAHACKGGRNGVGTAREARSRWSIDRLLTRMRTTHVPIGAKLGDLPELGRLRAASAGGRVGPRRARKACQCRACSRARARVRAHPHELAAFFSPQAIPCTHLEAVANEAHDLAPRRAPLLDGLDKAPRARARGLFCSRKGAGVGARLRVGGSAEADDEAANGVLGRRGEGVARREAHRAEHCAHAARALGHLRRWDGPRARECVFPCECRESGARAQTTTQ